MENSFLWVLVFSSTYFPYVFQVCPTLVEMYAYTKACKEVLPQYYFEDMKAVNHTRAVYVIVDRIWTKISGLP